MSRENHTERSTDFSCCGGNDEKPPHHCSDCPDHPWAGKPSPLCMTATNACPHAQRPAEDQPEAMPSSLMPAVPYPARGASACSRHPGAAFGCNVCLFEFVEPRSASAPPSPASSAWLQEEAFAYLGNASKDEDVHSLATFLARIVDKAERRGASAIPNVPAPESDLPLGLRTSPEKARQAMAILQKVGNPEDWLKSLVDGAVKETIALCAAAVRVRATYLEAHYVSDVSAQARHLALWLESDAGLEAIEYCDAVRDGERHGC